MAIVFRQILLGHLRTRRGTSQAESLQLYFNKSIKRIRRWESKAEKKFHGEIPRIARQLTSAMHPGDIEALDEKLRAMDFRPNLRKNLVQYNVVQYGKECYFMKAGRDIISKSIVAKEGSRIDHVVFSLEEANRPDLAAAITTLRSALKETPAEQFSTSEKQKAEALLAVIGKQATEPEPDGTVMETLGEKLVGMVEKGVPLVEKVVQALATIKTVCGL